MTFGLVFPALFYWFSWFSPKRYPSVRRRI